MNGQRFPAGWDEERVRRLLTDLDSRTDDEWAVADEAATADEDDQTVVTIPATLLPAVRHLLAAHESA